MVVLAQDQADAGDELEEIVVTGTRITTGNLGSAVPVMTVDSEYIQLSGETVLTNLLQQSPALIGSVSGEYSGSGGADTGAGGRDTDGTAALNLRNLGESRTLVLVNGRRHIASRAGTAVVDINTIPTALVERVDVLTGGASAIYGADGVSGVVNFIMKDDFEGMDFRVQANLPDDSGGENYLASATIGTNFADNRGNIALNVEYFRQDFLMNTDRGMIPGLPESISLNPDDDTGVDDPNLPDRIFVQHQALPLTSREGVLFTGPFDFGFFVPTYTGDGRVFDQAILLSDQNQIGGDGLPDFNPVTAPLISKQDRYNINLLSHYEFTDRAEAYFEFKYVDSEITSDGAAGSIDDGLAYSFENPFFPTSVPRDPFIMMDGPDVIGTVNAVVMGRDNFDLTADITDTRELTRTVLGLRGDLTDNIQYDVSYVYGEVETELLFPHTRIEDRFYAAMDAVVDPGSGDIVCRSNLDPATPPYSFWTEDPNVADWWGNAAGSPMGYSFFSSYDINNFGDPNHPSTTFTPGPNSGCEPLNLFGFGVQSPEAIAFTHLPTTERRKLTQSVFSAVINGDTESWFSLPAGPLGFALGAEYREEESRQTPDELSVRGATFDPPIAATLGKFDVTEFFGEISIPLLSGRTMFEDLSIGGAVRFSDYSTIGDTTTYRSTLSWSLVESFTLRGSFGRAIRAPNIDELFEPQVNTFFEPDDPCRPQFLGLGSSTRVANCTADLAAAGLALSDLQQASGPFLGFSGGNPDLIEETSDSFTFGAVFTPISVPGLSISLDFWDIEIEDAILQTSIQNIINSCYDAPDLNNQFCDTLSRSPVNGIFTSGQTSAVNIAFFESSGVDLEIVYNTDIAELFGSSSSLGDARIRLVGTKVDSLSVVPVPDGGADDELGELDTFLGGAAPKDVVNLDLTWLRNDWSVNYQYTYRSSVLHLEQTDLAQKPDTLFPFKTKSRDRHDLSAIYQFNDNFEVFGGVNNLTKPSREIGFIPIDRVFFIGARYATAGW
jgi:outer membrane receptor protein involved in Fe transport